MKLLLLLGATLIGTSFACSCIPSDGDAKYCGADWVSLVNVVSKESLKESVQIEYVVEHKKIFKKPSNVSSLPLKVRTRAFTSACGILLTTGKEYLLAGSLSEDGKEASSFSCQQLEGFNWAKRPTNFEETLKNIKCPQ